MNILVIDAQGGGLGRQLITLIRTRYPEATVTAVGTNAAATSAMLKAGAHRAATGENAVRVCARDADLIAGPIGITVADSMLGEITPAIAVAVGQARAKKILLPVSHCNNVVVGVESMTVGGMVEAAVELIGKEIGA